MKVKNYIIILFLTFLSLKSFATHIVGGEIYYDCLGNNDYRITLKVYRDCYNGVPPFDNPGFVFIFDNFGNFIDSIGMDYNGSVVLPPSVNNPCFIPPTDVCVEETIYEEIINLPPIPGGYHLTYQRCCRNNTILNLVNPGSVGTTYTAYINDSTLGACNSSPRYNNFPPIFICAGVPLVFDHSATDPDGDSLYYEFCDPFTGLSVPCPLLGGASGPGCPAIAPPPPYSFVPWQSPYNATYPMSSSPAMNLNAVTGLLTGTPNVIGQWVVGVCVSEYRNGVLLDVNKRDFQFNVVDCPNLPVASIPTQQVFCAGYQVDFTNNSLNAFSYHWDFGDPTTGLDTSNISSPTWIYADSGTYTVRLIINPGMLCADTNTTTFRIFPLLAPSFIPPAGECIYNNSFDFSATGAFMGNGTFSWNFGSHATPSASSQINPGNVVFDSAGTHPVTLTITENGCTASYMANVVVHPKPVARFVVATKLGCVLNPVQFTDSSISETPLTYLWNLGNEIIATEQNPITTYASVGTYNVSLIVTTPYGCKDTVVSPNILTVYSSPIAGFDVNPKDTSIFYPDITMKDQSQFGIACDVHWGDGSTDSDCNLIHAYKKPGTYTIMQVVVNAAGCPDTAYSEVIIRPEFIFWIPNAFTPGRADGINDIFKPKLIGVHNYKFMIFDRWGEQIFETWNPEEGWNGFYAGRLCQQDVYVYKIIFEDDVKNKHHEYIGKVTLVR
ncbi:MAG: PKD domain-containing protein [Bacteroidota bacterium]